MSTDTEALRARFEKLLSDSGRACLYEGDGQYAYPHDFSWLCFQAGHAAATAETADVGEPVAWRDVVGFEAAYEVSDRGDVRRKGSDKALANGLMGSGYVKADLWMNGKVTQVGVHRLVALAFLDNPNRREQVNHINGIKTDNRLVNLEWVSKSENEIHSRYSLGNLCKAVVATKIETGEELVFPSIATASKRTGVSRSAVGRCIESPGRASHGWVFRLAETFTADQLAAAVATERERWAAMCADIAQSYGGVAAGPMATERGKLVHESMAAGALNCADAIRAGAKEPSDA